MARDFDKSMDRARAAFEAGFPSEAARKRALADVNLAWEKMNDIVRDGILSDAVDKFPHARDYKAAWEPRAAWVREAGYWDLTTAHNFRTSKHLGFYERYEQGERARIAFDLRNAIKAAEIVVSVKDEPAKRAEAVRKSILEEMEARKVQYVRALDLGRLFGGLPVSVNAHWVHGHKGAVFLRHFFYLRGKLTPLNTIMAAADTLAREREGRA